MSNFVDADDNDDGDDTTKGDNKRRSNRPRVVTAACVSACRIDIQANVFRTRRRQRKLEVCEKRGKER